MMNSDAIGLETDETDLPPVKNGRQSKKGVWDFFSYDVVTKYGTCKYCDKRYKRNATRMAEHLMNCDRFRVSSDSHGVELKVARKPTLFVFHEEERSEDSNEGTTTLKSRNYDIDSDLISLEHGYYSEYVKPEPVVQRKRLKNEVENMKSSRSSTTTEDEFQIFGDHIAVELRKLEQHPMLLAETKFELSKILHRSVVECLNREEYMKVYTE